MVGLTCVECQNSWRMTDSKVHGWLVIPRNFAFDSARFDVLNSATVQRRRLCTCTYRVIHVNFVLVHFELCPINAGNPLQNLQKSTQKRTTIAPAPRDLPAAERYEYVGLHTDSP
jgi:hypothetical protein